MIRDNFEYRDQGFTKAKVLILLPTRNFCFDFVNTLISIIENISENQKVTITNRKRFNDEYGSLNDYDEIESDKYLKSFPRIN